LDNPIFKLEKVVQAKGSEPLEDFEGPLDLILYLLSKNKIEIQDIPIALILDQYQAYLEQRQRMDLEVASEFIAMAAHLVYIKTRMLLNLEDEEAQSEMDALIRSLEERQRGDTYAKVKVLTEKLGPMGEFGRDIMTRNPEPMERGKIYEYDQQPGDLIIAMQEVADRRGQLDAQPDLKPFDEIVRREPYSVETKAREIFRRLKTGGITRFLLLFRGSRSRSEIVATFMAVLELCRSRIIRLASGVNDCTVECDGDMPDDWQGEV
jgi:segregation and condensation protein A